MATYDDKTFFYETIPYALVFAFVYLVSTTCSGYVFPSFNKLDEGKKSVWGSSTNSLLLSMWVPYYTVKCGLENGGKFLTFDYPLSWTNPSIIEISKIMMGYFIVDGTVCFYMREKWGKGWSAFAIHHVSGAWYIRSCLFNKVGYGSLLAMNITEISNFFNMIRFFIGTITDKAGASITKRFPLVELVNGLLFSISFFILRIYGFTHIGWWSLIHERAELAKQSGEFQITIHCCFIIGISLQFYWMYLISIGLYKLLAGKSKKNAEGSTDDKIVKND
jgi:hypothetical protein